MGKTDRPLLVTWNWSISVKNTSGWSAVVFWVWVRIYIYVQKCYVWLELCINLALRLF